MALGGSTWLSHVGSRCLGCGQAAGGLPGSRRSQGRDSYFYSSCGFPGGGSPSALLGGDGGKGEEGDDVLYFNFRTNHRLQLPLVHHPHPRGRAHLL